MERAARIFDTVIVALPPVQKKAIVFLDERVELAQNVLSKYKNVQVTGLIHLLLDFAKQHQPMSFYAACEPSLILIMNFSWPA